MSDLPTRHGTITVRLSKQSVQHLDDLSRVGILGATAEEVAARFIDQGLQRFCPPPVLREPPPRK